MCTGGWAHGALYRKINRALELEERRTDICGSKQNLTPRVAECMCGVCRPEREQVRGQP